MSARTGYYYWIRLKGNKIWEPAYRFRGHEGKDVWLVIATSEDIEDDKVEHVGPKLQPPSDNV